MSIRPVAVIATDFAEVQAHLQGIGILESAPPADKIRIARRIHGYTYSLILWKFRLPRIPECGKVFLEEIASDALQILPQALVGYSKTAKLLTRGIVENTLRHIYFIDHPIEFQRMNREKKWYLTIDALVEYGKAHPIFFETESKFDAFNQISSLYSDLSAGIHGRTVRDLETRRALREITYDATAAEKESEFLRRCVEVVNFLLCMLHRDAVARFQNDDRSIILRSIPVKARQVWRRYDP
jgi:hypothetical protein